MFRSVARAVASLLPPDGQDMIIFPIFPQFLVFSFIFPHTFFIFVLILVFRVGGSPTREGPAYATERSKLFGWSLAELTSIFNDCGMGWFQVDFSRKGHMSRPRNWYSKEFSQIAIEICYKKCAFPTDLDCGVVSIKSMFLYFSGPNINHS